MKSLGIIPARYASSRFPAKVLADINGKSMLQRVWEQAKKSLLDEVIIATDHTQIYDHALSFGAKTQLTSINHKTGTDRCAEVWSKIQTECIYNLEAKDIHVIVNLQGDEPFIKPEQINLLVKAFANTQSVDIITLIKKIKSTQSLFNNNIVKVIFNENTTDHLKNAIYFSRQPIPFLRDIPEKDWLEYFSFYKHIGLYAFRSSIFDKISKLKQHNLEKAESLEQLRWLANAYKIGLIETNWETIGIDKPEDLVFAKKTLLSNDSDNQ